MKTNPNDPPEIWKDIPNYEGRYQVSNLGRIKSLPKSVTYSTGRTQHYPEKIMKPVVSKYTGYVNIGLNNGSKSQKTYRIQRLVAEVFIDNPNNLPEVNHLNYDKLDNSVLNLEWADRYRQNQHSALKPNRKWQSHRTGISGSLNHKSIPVSKIDLQTMEIIETYESGNLAAITKGANQSKISKCCKGERNSHAGYKWSYADALIKALNKQEEPPT